MLKHAKKILLILRKVFHIYPNAAEDTNPDDFYHSKRSTEGWELVDDLSEPIPPAGAKYAGNKTSRVKSSLPPYPVIWTYFTANGYPDAEALSFYKRYQVMGWNERIIPTLDNWPELADHWVHLARQSRKPDNTKPPADDADTASDNNHPGPV